MKILISILLIFLIYSVNAQNISTVFGKVNLNDLNLKEYPDDKNAEAAFLYDKGKSYFIRTENGFQVVFERAFKIKIFKKSGFKWGEIEIPYYFSGETYEKVSDIEAYSYNIENSVIKRDQVDPQKIYEEKTNEYWRNKKFALPNIKEGTVIEVKYTITSPRVFELRNWEFQTTIPSFYSEYTTKMIPFFTYDYILQGRSNLDIFDHYEEKGLSETFMGMEYHDIVYVFGMKNIPAFNDETFITSYNDYILKINFQLSKVEYPDGYKKDIITTWPKLVEDLLEEPDFDKFLNASEKTGKKIPEIIQCLNKNENEKLETIINYVKINYNWDEKMGYFAYKKLKDFLKDKTGNIGCINLYLAGLLRAAGLEAYPVILSTRKHGKIKSDYPFVHYFNYVVVLVNINEKKQLVDASEPMCSYNHIPPRCVNEKGLVIKKGEENWINLSYNELSSVNTNLNISFSKNSDTIIGIASNIYTLNQAYDIKEKYKDDKEKIKKDLIIKNYQDIDSLITQNYLETSKDYKIKFNLKMPVEKIDNKLYISPFLNEPKNQNPLKQSTRTYPVDFIYPFGYRYKSIITIPEGYKIGYLPQPLKIDNDKALIEYQTLPLDANHLIVNGIYNFKKSVYQPDEYSDIKYYYNEIVKKFNEKIVLVHE